MAKNWTNISPSQLSLLGALKRQKGNSMPIAHAYPDPYTDEKGVRHQFNTVRGCKEKGWITVTNHGHQMVGHQERTIYVISITPKGMSVLQDVLDLSLGLTLVELV